MAFSKRNKKMTKSVGDYYKMYCDGSPFSDEELDDAVNKFGKLLSMVDSLGKEFVLFRREIMRVYGGLQDFQFHRIYYKDKK
jgi:hypothetical protein